MEYRTVTTQHQPQAGMSFFSVMLIIVILAGTVGGWLGLSYFKKAYRVKAVVAELTEFSAAAKSFHDVYEYFPGDMPNATTFWLNDTDCPGPNCCPGIAWSAGGCNGNGNNQVKWGNEKDNNESLRAWQHLVLAGQIQGGYDGVGRGTNEAVIGVNVPASRASGIGYDFHYGAVGPIKERNYIGVGGYMRGGAPQSPALTPSEAYNIDKKIDDGYPLGGNFVSSNGIGVSECTRGFVETSSTYNSTNDSLQCISHYNIDPAFER